MDITPQQAAEIRKLVRRANRRIERATGGHESSLQYMVKKLTGAEKFSAATKGLTYEQAAAKLKQLDRFLGAKTTTISGWKEVKQENVEKATETLERMGYDITDEEFSEILKQIDSMNKKEFYHAINKVAAAKEEAGDEWTVSSEQIREALAEKISFQEAQQRAIEARNNRR